MRCMGATLIRLWALQQKWYQPNPRSQALLHLLQGQLPPLLRLHGFQEKIYIHNWWRLFCCHTMKLQIVSKSVGSIRSSQQDCIAAIKYTFGVYNKTQALPRFYIMKLWSTIMTYEELYGIHVRYILLIRCTYKYNIMVHDPWFHIPKCLLNSNDSSYSLHHILYSTHLNSKTKYSINLSPYRLSFQHWWPSNVTHS